MTVDRGASPLDKNRHQFKGLRGEQVMDEADPVEGMETASDAPLTAGQRLRAAREAAGMSLDEIATATRIPTRHLQSLEDSDFEKMPSPTYSIGFAKNYAAAVGLDRAEIGDMVRTEMGGYRPPQPIEYYEPADPSRAFPKWVVVAVLAALALVVAGFSWVKSRELDAPDAVVANEEVAANVPAPVAATPAAAQPVAVTANDVVWVEIKEASGAILFQGEMQKGQRYDVPASAVAPLLKTGRPEALAITVGTDAVPPVGQAGQPVANVSLLAADLTKPRTVAAPPTASAAPTSARPAPRPSMTTTRAAPPTVEPAPESAPTEAPVQE